MIIISQETIAGLLQETNHKNQHLASFVEVDDGDVFLSYEIGIASGKKRRVVNGMIRFETESQHTEADGLPPNIDVLVVAHMLNTDSSIVDEHLPARIPNIHYNGWVRIKQQIEPRSVQAVPIREELFSRVYGLYETSVLAAKTALIIGVGSGGSTIALELVKAGVGNFILVDPDRIEVVNVVRHLCGLSDLGRF